MIQPINTTAPILFSRRFFPSHPLKEYVGPNTPVVTDFFAVDLSAKKLKPQRTMLDRLISFLFGDTDMGLTF